MADAAWTGKPLILRSSMRMSLEKKKCLVAIEAIPEQFLNWGYHPMSHRTTRHLGWCKSMKSSNGRLVSTFFSSPMCPLYSYLKIWHLMTPEFQFRPLSFSSNVSSMWHVPIVCEKQNLKRRRKAHPFVGSPRLQPVSCSTFYWSSLWLLLHLSSYDLEPKSFFSPSSLRRSSQFMPLMVISLSITTPGRVNFESIWHNS